MGYDAVVTRGAHPNRETAKVAAEEKTINNLTMAIARITADHPHDTKTLGELKQDLKDAKLRLVDHKKTLAERPK